MGIEIGKIQARKAYTKEREVNASRKLKSFFGSKKLNSKKKGFIYKDMATLLTAGIDFKTTLTIIRDQQKNEHASEIINQLLTNVVKGKAFYEAMEISGEFTPYEVYSVKIGEETRRLDTILLELQKYFDRKLKLKKQIISILTYPAFILVLTLATLYFMLTYVVPLFESVFNQFNRELPTLTRYVIILSEHFNLITLFVVGIMVITVFIYKKVKKQEAFQKAFTSMILKVPFFGKLIREIYITRFCQSMALLLVSKTSLVESIGLVRKMIAFYPIEAALIVMEKDISKGIGLGDSLSKFKIFDANIISMVRVAEQVNQLDAMFLTLANHYDAEVEHKTKVMGTIIEPMLILFIGSIVGLIMISMYAPMFDLSEVIGGS
ncbi:MULTISPECIES: type II secretion system F family protein [Aequorivita]|uniref:General secretion pathway protein F n=1 Tax=Aequorivita iocasae TaxID=2803865 RepID=A0ABX7DUS5_9FLAO|nr:MULTISPECIES: type II secretion system F family protein [Aequorivita]QQX76504.1 type II secretion system F family protein [Aequorivita iocasae]UCA55977.1 type II secretion system F family protein [Aequorivita sp. F7]